MTGKVINLKAARKARDRTARRAEADVNAARHGRSRAEQERDRSETERNAARLDQHRLEEE